MQYVDADFFPSEIPSLGLGDSKSATFRGYTGVHGLSSLIFRFPPNFVRQLSVKARRNCSNIGVAQVVAASWSNNQGDSAFTPAAKAVDAAAAALAPVELEGLPPFKYASFLNSDGSVAIHAGERLGRGIVTDAITTPVVNTSAYFFNKTADLIDFKVLAGCISGPEKLISAVRNLHHILGGALNPIRRVYYPGLASHPEHELAKKQMNGLVDGDLLTTAKFVDALRIPYIAPSFGGCESIVDQPAIMSYWDLPPSERAKYGILDNLVRFSFGVEDFEDLKADILQALETI
ncbi:UNVERIFIED_CONTAM: Cystathionine gamma-synthase 1, chloroplastic [Sesamum angustifolium]|uniref:Cystathionine gamma-synthase 1, chloroplastic n=1 Tax=Sesamum angustifolium TaxID=2727405 RepID=A0AAW2NIM6_9LAMI